MAGRRAPIRWPEGARIAITPGVAFETWPSDLGAIVSLQNSTRRPFPPNAVTKKNFQVITDREYGDRVGIFRMLDLFKREKIATTFFVSGIHAVRFPETFKEIKEGGHEIGAETYIHDYAFMKTLEQERDGIKKSIEAIQQTTGERPLGYLSTGVTPSEFTAPLVAELGFFYWADPQHDEIPYTLKVGGKEIVVLSYNNFVNDYTTFRAEDRSPRETLQMWKDWFDYVYAEGATDPKFMIWGLHPFLTGRPYRARILEEFIQYAKRHPKVWFARCIDIARWWHENYKDQQVEEWPNYHIAGQRAKAGDLLKEN